MFKVVIKSFVPAVLALIVATLLFCLPGKEFPEAGWLQNLHLDKIVHIGLFTVLVAVWSLPFAARSNDKRKVNQRFLLVMVCFIIYGIAIEFIQRDLIPHRSFEAMDIVADTFGCVAGIVVARWVS